MPLMPKRVKYRKTQRGSRAGNASRTLKIDFGEFGLQTLDRAWITNIQIEAARVAMTRNMKRKGKLRIRIFPDTPITRKPAEVRMGSGKGSVDHYAAKVTSESFRGISRVKQHQIVYAALQGRMGGVLHALALQTSAPE